MPHCHAQNADSDGPSPGADDTTDTKERFIVRREIEYEWRIRELMARQRSRMWSHPNTRVSGITTTTAITPAAPGPFAIMAVETWLDRRSRHPGLKVDAKGSALRGCATDVVRLA